MGMDPVTIGLLVAGISGGMGLAGGMMQNNAADRQSDKQMAFQK